MDNQEFITSNDKLEFRQIVLGHLRKILDLSLKPYEDEGAIQRVKIYRDSIVALSDVLVSFYDKQMNDIYNEYEKEHTEVIKKTTGDGVIKNEGEYIGGIKRVCRKLFRELNLLMKRVDYLKGTVYGEERESTELIEVDK